MSAVPDPASVDRTEEILARYRARTPGSAAAHAAARLVMPGGDTRSTTFCSPYPLSMTHGAGCRLWDVDGHEYLDFLGNYTSMIHGHAHPAIVAAVTAQFQRGTAFGSPLALQTTLANTLVARVPSLERIRFCNSGTEATLNAIRAAKAFTGRRKVLKMEGGYHGSHDAVEVSVAPPAHGIGPAHAPYSVPDCPGLFASITDEVLVAPFNDIASTEALIAAHAADLAAVIVEPVLGSAGVIPATQAYLESLKRACESTGALLIFDEVVTLRLAYGGAQSLYGVMPDLTAMGKIIGGGFPIGAFGGRAEVMEQFDPARQRLHQGGTYNGNAISMVAGQVAMELLDEVEIHRLNDLGDRLRMQLNEALAASGVQGHVAGVGSLLQLHLGAVAPVSHYRDTFADDRRAHDALHLALLTHGFFGAKRGEYALSTPMTESDIALAVQRFTSALDDLKGGGSSG